MRIKDGCKGDMDRFGSKALWKGNACRESVGSDTVRFDMSCERGVKVKEVEWWGNVGC